LRQYLQGGGIVKLLASFLAIAILAIPALAADVTGKWSGSFTPNDSNSQGGASTAYMVLKQSGTTITGTGGPDENQQWAIQNGKFENNKLTGEVHDENGMVYKVALILSGDHLKGDVTVVTPDGQTIPAKCDVQRVK
jgi:hypothetical protein